VLRPELAATLGSERFLQEIETAAQVQHPHILAVHDSGDAQGFLYYVMPYVEGESLRTRLARAPRHGTCSSSRAFGKGGASPAFGLASVGRGLLS
jgi:serine/threonine protein kinase